MNGRPPKVSVLIPVRNREDLLPAALASAQAQTETDLEIIVIDNQSTDGTAAVAQHAARTDSRIHVEVNPVDLGGLGNFRRCLARATGTYVKFLMSDDVLAPGAVETLLRGLEDPRVTLATSKRDRISLTGDRLPDTAATRLLVDSDRLLDGRALGDHVLMHNLNVIGEPTTTMFRRADLDADAALTFGGQQWRTNVDVALWLFLLARGGASYSTQPLSSLRVHDGQDQGDPRVHLIGVREWFELSERALAYGFLSAPESRLTAIRTFLVQAASTIDLSPGVPDSDLLVAAMATAVQRVEQLRAGQAAEAAGQPTSLVCPVDWDDKANLQRLLGAWVNAFPAGSAVRLVLPLTDATSADGAAAFLGSALLDLGVAPESVNDVVVATPEDRQPALRLAAHVVQIHADADAAAMRQAVLLP